MINYISHDDGIKILTQLMLEERLIPIFGAGYTKDSPSYSKTVPDGKLCTDLMKNFK